MLLLYVLLVVYIVAVNFYGWRIVKSQRDAREEGGCGCVGDGKLLLASVLGGSVAIFASMFAMKYRLDSIVLMVGLPLLAVFNFYCFFLAFRGIYFLV